MYGEIPCVQNLTEEEIHSNYEKNAGILIVEHFKGIEYMAMPAVLCKNHGPFSWGKDTYEAVHNAVVLEEAAKMAWRLAQYVEDVSASDVNVLVEEYYGKYQIIDEGREPEEFRRHVTVQAGIEIGFLGSLKQLPGLAIQRLMEKGYGFGGEGDWKTAAMVRLMKLMTTGMKDAKGTSFMEDYTYNLVPGREGILQAHVLEVCPTIAEGPIGIKVCPLSMGNREDPARLVFNSKEGSGIAASLVDLGNRFRLIINEVDCKKTEKPMPKLPVAANFWMPKPNMAVGAESWILAGGAHRMGIWSIYPGMGRNPLSCRPADSAAYTGCVRRNNPNMPSCTRPGILECHI